MKPNRKGRAMVEKAEVFNLTEFQLSTDRKGPWKLYIYRPDGLYEGGVWFRRAPKYPSEEITGREAQGLALAAIQQRREVRICDGGDMLVFHSKGGTVLHGEGFFQEIT